MMKFKSERFSDVTQGPRTSKAMFTNRPALDWRLSNSCPLGPQLGGIIIYPQSLPIPWAGVLRLEFCS